MQTSETKGKVGEDVVIVNAYGRSNRGDAVLLDECIREIRNFNPHAKITCALYEGFDSGTEANSSETLTERIGNSRAPGVLRKFHSIANCAIALFIASTRLFFFDKLLPKHQAATLRTIFKSSMMVSAPGGYIHDTNLAYYIAILHIYIGLLAGNRVILAPQSIGPIRSSFGRWIAKIALSRVEICCVREQYSKEFLLNELCISPSKVKITGDSAFWDVNVCTDESLISYEWNKAGFPKEPHKKILGVTVVNWSFPTAEDANNQRAKYIATMATVIKEISNRYGLAPVIFNQVSDDIPIAKEIAAQCSCEIFIDEIEREPKVLRALLSRSTIFLGTRFHSCIFALMAGVPTIAIAYLPKTTNILFDLGLSGKSMSIDKLDASELIDKLSNELDNLDYSRNQVKNSVKQYQASMSRLQDFL